MARKQRNVVTVDPDLLMRRFLHYVERGHGWMVFRAFYWGIYIVVVSLFLIYYNSINFTINMFLGISLLLFAVMLMIFGLTESLHHKLMKRYG